MNEIPRFCRFCGKILESETKSSGFFKREVAKECKCPDVQLNKEIDRKIEDLEGLRPDSKYDLFADYSIKERK